MKDATEFIVAKPAVEGSSWERVAILTAARGGYDLFFTGEENPLEAFDEAEGFGGALVAEVRKAIRFLMGERAAVSVILEAELAGLRIEKVAAH
jgi:hypothetical protein